MGSLLESLEKKHCNLKEITHIYIRNCSRKWSNSGTVTVTVYNRNFSIFTVLANFVESGGTKDIFPVP